MPRRAPSGPCSEGTSTSTVSITGSQPYRAAITADSAYAVVGVINDAVTSSFSVISLSTLSEVRSFPTAPQGEPGFTWTSGYRYKSSFTQFKVTPDGAIVVISPIAVALLGILFERFILRADHVHQCVVEARLGWRVGVVGTHLVAVRADSRSLTDDGDVDMGNAPAARLHPVDGESEKAVRRDTPPLRIGGRKMHADIAFG